MEAEALHRETLLGRQLTLNDYHPQTLMSMHILAECLRQQDKDLRQVIELHQGIVRQRRLALGTQHVQTLESVQCLGRALCQSGIPQEGRQHIEGALSGLQQAVHPCHPKVILCMEMLA